MDITEVKLNATRLHTVKCDRREYFHTEALGKFKIWKARDHQVTTRNILNFILDLFLASLPLYKTLCTTVHQLENDFRIFVNYNCNSVIGQYELIYMVSASLGSFFYKFSFTMLIRWRIE
ncbi:hypothetical protein QQ045_020670 [Rhodiola kirilowii]